MEVKNQCQTRLGKELKSPRTIGRSWRTEVEKKLAKSRKEVGRAVGVTQELGHKIWNMIGLLPLRNLLRAPFRGKWKMENLTNYHLETDKLAKNSRVGKIYFGEC